MDKPKRKEKNYRLLFLSLSLSLSMCYLSDINGFADSSGFCPLQLGIEAFFNPSCPICSKVVGGDGTN
jgi:hypothetical protein